VFDRGPAVQSAAVAAGQIGKLWGLGDIQIGDTVRVVETSTASHRPGANGCRGPEPSNGWEPAGGSGRKPEPGECREPQPGECREPEPGDCRYFAPPTLETVVVPCRLADKGALHLALSQLAEQDPLINLRQDDRRGEMYVSLYGEVQKEVIQATLAQEYAIDVHFRETSVICIERPIGTGEALERLGKGDNPFLATVGLRVEPASEGAGVELRLEVEVASIPLFIFKAVEEFQRAMEDTVRTTLQQGLHGWQVTDCTVTLTECGYVSPPSTARDFRLLTPLVLMSALQEAGTSVYEPIHRFHLEIPADTYGSTIPILARLGAVLQSSATRDSSYTLEGEILATQVHQLQHQLPAATRGEGVLEWDFDSYQPVSGAIPTRPRSDYNPLNRKEYLLHVVRRV
jgi:ribosomal protection tetracycline resistance protein